MTGDDCDGGTLSGVVQSGSALCWDWGRPLPSGSLKDEVMKWILTLMLGFVIGRFGFPKDPNSYPTYGTTGLPKNCRAIIQANIDGVAAHQFIAEDALNSIGRNCGRYGYGWDE